MTVTDQFNEIVIFAKACRDAEGRQATNIREKYLWKIKRLVDDMIMLHESGDKPLDKS